MTDRDQETTTVRPSEPEQPSESTTSALEQHPHSDVQAVESESAEDHVVKEEEVDPLEQARKEANENRDRWMRAVAELENYKKRVAQDRGRWQKYRHEDLLKALLPVVDNMDRAAQHCSDMDESNPVAEGVRMIAGMFRDLLAKYGVTEIQALGKPFDPQFHEGIGRMPSEEAPPNTVIDQLEKGYMYHDRLLRPAKVVISVDQGQP